MEYRGDFITGIISVIISNGVTLSLIAILLGQFSSLGNWNLWEIVFLYNVFLLGHSINSIFFWHIRELDRYIVSGKFDQFLIRPVNPLVQLLGRELNYMGIGDIVVAVVGIYLSVHNLNLSWGYKEVFLFPVIILSGAIIEFSISLIFSSISFWVLNGAQAIYQIFMRFNLLVQQYPVNIFGKWFQMVVTFIIPVAFINYYPSLLLLNKTDPWVTLGYFSPLVSGALLVISLIIWRRGLERYSSSGN